MRVFCPEKGEPKLYRQTAGQPINHARTILCGSNPTRSHKTRCNNEYPHAREPIYNFIAKYRHRARNRQAAKAWKLPIAESKARAR